MASALRIIFAQSVVVESTKFYDNWSVGNLMLGNAITPLLTVLFQEYAPRVWSRVLLNR